MSARRWPLVVVMALGAGLALAPAAFRMFERAPRGGDMIVGFPPYMTVEKIDGFRADLDVIGAAHAEVTALGARLPAGSLDRYGAVASFGTAWPAIQSDMGSMLDTMGDNVARYRGVAALPPFPLFPWFFVIPGVLIAAAAAAALRAGERRRSLWPRWAMVVLGIGVVAAPVAFQMFSRAPGGSRMIDDFEPFMTRDKVADLQGYFLVIGGAEGELRRAVVPELTATGAITPGDVASIATLNAGWPSIAGEMAPMIGAMADNIGNFEAVAALPPFWLFPWFFFGPGVAVVGLAIVSARARPGDTSDNASGIATARSLEGAPS